MTQGPDALPTVHQLKVTLRDVRPTVWRRLLVPSVYTLGDLHENLQIAFDWEGTHLHLFDVGRVQFGPLDMREPFGGSAFGELPRDEHSATLAEVAPGSGAELTYSYDLGDDWRHRIEVEEVIPAEPDRFYPTCVDGRGLAPGEDGIAVPPGRFDKAALEELNDVLEAGGETGQELGALANHEMVGGPPSDPIFSDLFPDFVITPEGPCTCGEEHDLEDAPTLRAYHPVSDDILAELARSSDLFEQAMGLARWVGEGKALSPSLLLRPADALQAVAALGLSEPAVTPIKKLRSAKDLPTLHSLWAAAVNAELIEIHGSQANIGPGIEVWDDNSDASDRLESWARLLAGYLQARAEPIQGWDPVVDTQMMGTSAQLFYSLAIQPMPAALPALILTAESASDPAPAFWMVGHVATAIESAARDWIRVGVLKVLTDTGENPPSEGIAQVKAMIAELTAGIPLDDAPAGMIMKPLLDAVRDSPIVQLTPLGSYGLRRLLIAHGWEVPQIGDLAEVPPTELLDQLESYEYDDAVSEAEVWLEAQGDQWQAALDDVLETARSKDLDLGPARRLDLQVVLKAAGARAEPVLEALADDPWLSAVAARVAYELEFGPAPTVAQELWLAVDAISLDRYSDEELAIQGIDASGILRQLERPGAIEAAATLSHPSARESLLQVAALSSDRQVGAELRRALGARPIPPSAKNPFKKKPSRKR